MSKHTISIQELLDNMSEVKKFSTIQSIYRESGLDAQWEDFDPTSVHGDSPDDMNKLTLQKFSINALRARKALVSLTNSLEQLINLGLKPTTKLYDVPLFLDVAYEDIPGISDSECLAATINIINVAATGGRHA